MNFRLGVIGLGTMGANLARNAARRGQKVVVFNRTKEKTEEFLRKYRVDGDFKGAYTYKDLVQSLDHPRAILIMVNAGEAVDQVIEELLPEIKQGDILIDGGNSHFADTERRAKVLNGKGMYFIGLGVSGGEKGALEGPSLMPGSEKAAYDLVEPLLQQIAAQDGEGGKCVSYLGPGGAGHFVKMVHNGIEYGIMQLIAESYAILKGIGGFTNVQLAETFAAWNKGEDLQSFLIEITSEIFKKMEGDVYLVDVIKDRAGQKGTGKWTVQAAHDFGVAVPTISAAVDARILSGSENERQSGKAFPSMLDAQDPVPPHEKLRSIVRHALILSEIVTYIQGFTLLEWANKEKEWGMDLSEVARIWRGGCIIRSALLQRFQHAFGMNKALAKAAKDGILERFQGERQLDWRRAVTYASSRGVAVPAMAASLSYYDALRAQKLPQNLIQAQRDFFGAHGFERVDGGGEFHGEWGS